MEIRQSLPFQCCEDCKDFILNVEEQTIFGDGRIAMRILYVSCKNENLCRRLEQHRRESKIDER